MQTFPTVEALWSTAATPCAWWRRAPALLRRLCSRSPLASAPIPRSQHLHAVLLKPLPYADPDRLMMLWEQLPDNGEPHHRVPANSWTGASRPARSLVWRRSTRHRALIMSGTGEPARLSAAGVSWDFSRFSARLPSWDMASWRKKISRPQSRRDPFAQDLGRSIRRGFRRRWQEHQPQRDPLHHGRRPAAGLRAVGEELRPVVPGSLRRLGSARARRKPVRGTHPLRVVARLKPGLNRDEARQSSTSWEHDLLPRTG